MKMKRLFAYLTILAMMVLSSCSGRYDNAALNMYYKYADNENLTVAYLGGLTLNGDKIDALMIKANLNEDWDSLKNSFGMLTRHDSVTERPENQKVVSVGVGIDANFVKDLGLDTITDINQVDEERFNNMKEIIAGKIREIVGNFPTDGSISMDEYIDTLAVTVANQLLNEVIKMNEASLIEKNDSPMTDANEYGHKGYVSAADDNTRTIWLFFYDNQEECNNILKHISKDILTNYD